MSSGVSLAGWVAAGAVFEGIGVVPGGRGLWLCGLGVLVGWCLDLVGLGDPAPDRWVGDAEPELLGEVLPLGEDDGVVGVLTAVVSGFWKEIAKDGAICAPGVGDGSSSMP